MGLDDTDSRSQGMCTTYLATLIAEEVSGPETTVTDRLLVRLNPNAPHRTRGNACLALQLDTEEPERVKRTVVDFVERYAVFDDPETNPGAAFLLEDEAARETADFTLNAVRRVVDKDKALKAAERAGIDVREWENGRGVIGAVAAIGAAEVFDDWTYELLAYRDSGWGDERKVDRESFFRAHRETGPYTWDTVDKSGGVVTAVPNTRGPVVYGLRGTFEGVWRANTVVGAEADHVSVYRTNQGTDMHLVDASADEVEDMRSYRVSGRVTEAPETHRGGHVFLEVDGLLCAAFEPTKEFRDVVRELHVGDEVTVCGSVVDGTLNLEKFRVGSLVRTEKVNPTCGCGRSMESAGRGQGYRCRDCGETREGKVERRVERDIGEGWYEVPPSARRHLAKPLVRMEIEDRHVAGGKDRL